MYNYTLIFQLYMRSSVLEDVLLSLPVPDGFSHQIDVQPKASPEPSDCLTIKILSMTDLLETLPELQRKDKKTSYWVLCAQPEELSLLTLDLLCCLDALCPLPLTKTGVSFCFYKLLQQIKQEKDCSLSQAYLDTTIDSLPDLIWFKDIRGAHLKVNDSFCNAVGKTKKQVQGRGHYYIWDLTEEEYEKGEYVCLDTEETVLELKKTCLFDEMVKTKNDMLRLRTYKSPIFDDLGNVIGTVGVAQDITELKNTYMEQEIIFQNIPFALLLHDPNGNITNVNQRFSDYFRVDQADILGTDYDSWAKHAFSETTASSPDGYLEAFYTRNSEQLILQIHRETIFDTFDVPVRYLWVYRDITLERHFKEKMLYAANSDYLTGLCNRRSLYEFVNLHGKTDTISLFSLDLDNFKQVNDTYGHEAGDNALILLARILQELFPLQFISRLGGDEFMIVFLNQTDISALTSSAEKLLLKVRNSFSSHMAFKDLSVSIGIMFNIDKESSFDYLMKCADHALYDAKQSGKNQIQLWHPKPSYS